MSNLARIETILQERSIDESTFVAALEEAIDIMFGPIPGQQPLGPDEREFLERHGGVEAAGPDEVSRRSVLVAATGAIRRQLTWDVGQVAELLGVSPSRVRHRIAERALYALPARDRKRRFPRWQFVEDGVLPGLDLVLRELPGDLHPAEVEAFFLRPHAAIPALREGAESASPREWLASGGDPDVVVDAAGFLVERS